MASIALESVVCSYGETPVLRGVDLVIADGELHTVLGPSGCGKTTTLRLIAGFLQPDAGRILVDGREVTDLPPEKRRMGVVFQNYALFPQMTVAQNVAYGLKVARRPKAEVARAVGEYLDLVGLAEVADRNAMELSGGQQQRVALARALAPEPRVLLLDEPLSNLDAELRQRMREEIRRIQRQVGVTTLFITHDQQEALALSDTVSVMHDGAIVQTGSPREVYEHPADAFVAAFTGEVNRLRGLGSDGGDALVRPEALRLVPAAKAGPRALACGRVVSVRYEGFAIQYQVACEDTVGAGALVRPAAVGGRAANAESPGLVVTVLALNDGRSPFFAEGDAVAVERP